jgi:hypothetical protein
MGRDQKTNEANRLSVLDSVRGHESSIAHSFNHTGGQCPKCGFPQQEMFFCLPDQNVLPRLRSCELDGEHLHRMCRACHYPWIERCLDQAMLSEREGRVIAESELAAVLAVVAERTEGIELDSALVSSRRGWELTFFRDPEKRTIRVTSAPAPPQSGRPAHPSADDVPGAPA